MSKDNLILFPNKRKPNIDMTNAEAKWMVSGSLVVVLCVALGINASLFSQGSSDSSVMAGSVGVSSRSIASVNPIFRISWEKKAFEVLENTEERDLANVGEAPSALQELTVGDLEGRYQVRKVNGLISEIQWGSDQVGQPKSISQVDVFLKDHMALFSSEAQDLQEVHVESNGHQSIQRYSLLNAQGDKVGAIQVHLNGQQQLLSMTVQ